MHKPGAFVKTPFFQEIIKRSLQYLSAGYPVHYVGPSGVGKTSLALYVASELKRPVTVIRGHHEMTNVDLIGGYFGFSKSEVIDNYIHSVYKKLEDFKSIWTNGQLAEAVKNGHTLVFDEFTRSHPETNNIFLSIIEERILPLYGKQNEAAIPVHPNFSVIFTSNPEEYAGVFKTQDALIDRLITVDLDYCDLETESHIVSKNTGVNIQDAKMITQIVRHFRLLCSNKKRQGPSLRASIMIASVAKKSHIPIHLSKIAFQELCRNVLWLPVYRCHSEWDKQSVIDFIFEEFNKLAKDEKVE